MIEDTLTALTRALQDLGAALDRNTAAMDRAVENSQNIINLVQDGRLAVLEAKTAALLPDAPPPVTGAQLMDAFPAFQPAAPEPAPEKEVTHEDLRELGKRIIEQDGNPTRFKAYIADHFGVKTLSNIPYADLDRAAEGLRSLIR